MTSVKMLVVTDNSLTSVSDVVKT